jgi:hypothetical protein
MSRPSSNRHTSSTRSSRAATSGGQQANASGSLPLYILEDIYGTPRRPVFSSRRITPKDADYDGQMLSEIDHQFRSISYEDFMKNYVPDKSNIDVKAMKRASLVLAKGLNVAFVKDNIKEVEMYPPLVCATHAQLGQGHLMMIRLVRGVQHYPTGLFLCSQGRCQLERAQH